MAFVVAGSHEHSHSHGHSHGGEACTGHGGFQEADRHGEQLQQDRDHRAGLDLNVYAMWLHTLQVSVPPTCLCHLRRISVMCGPSGYEYFVVPVNFATDHGEASLACLCRGAISLCLQAPYQSSS